ncbi:DUF1768-domain-containing protein [Polyplosphaeria fusca]|uniref:DUF1768-domain-containing protein n=1 Tax=Polyplosphaeria fusca TaxID=682080 RepID=A0A9P4UZ99_9PLEO|nr:DUF1768-domain-containing protein [Polyplosphaeria fusca]
MPPKPTPKIIKRTSARLSKKLKLPSSTKFTTTKLTMPPKPNPEKRMSAHKSKKLPLSTKSSTAELNMPVQTTSTTTPTGQEPIYFWKPTQEHGYLGQWHHSPFTINGSTYATAEMWMMVQKAVLFGDEQVASEMLETTDAKIHKALGRTVKGFDEGVWKSNRMRIVVEGNMHKFTIAEGAEEMRAWLLGTGERELVEASPMDRIWGIGFGKENAGRNRGRWGLNLLGKALMEVRGRLREEEEEEEGKREEEGKKKGEAEGKK